jgi:DNA uptake protein ComE-like DNA-binding protein
MRKTYKVAGRLLAIAALALVITAPVRAAGSEKQSAGASAKVDLNGASEKDLEGLPGVGAATAKKIIAGRPYSSTSDLSKAGVSAATIKKITPLVTVGGASAAPGTSFATRSAAPKPSASTPGGGKVDLNSASAAELKELPGVGDATAKKIISGRPYSAVGDLSKAGVSATTIGKITPLVTVGRPSIGNASPPTPSAAATSPAPTAAAPAAPAPSPAPSPMASSAPAKSSPPAAQGSPGNGMVWVNTETGVYHKEGTKYYGKTKHGKYLSEPDAIKAGYRAAKNE